MNPKEQPAAAQRKSRPAYTIARLEQEHDQVPLCGSIAGTPWARARALHLTHYPWYSGGERQATTVRLLYDEYNLFVQFRCQDRHSSARVTAFNGPVYQDSCIEFFATITPERGPEYFNLEINCCGTMHLGFGPGREGRRLITAEQAQPIQIVTSVGAPVKVETPADRAWWVVARLPFSVIGELAGAPVLPSPGTRWRANFYRCGGQTDPQYACWAPVATSQPDYHRPEYFRELVFG